MTNFEQIGQPSLALPLSPEQWESRHDTLIINNNHDLRNGRSLSKKTPLNPSTLNLSITLSSSFTVITNNHPSSSHPFSLTPHLAHSAIKPALPRPNNTLTQPQVQQRMISWTISLKFQTIRAATPSSSCISSLPNPNTIVMQSPPRY